MLLHLFVDFFTLMTMFFISRDFLRFFFKHDLSVQRLDMILQLFPSLESSPILTSICFLVSAFDNEKSFIFSLLN